MKASPPRRVAIFAFAVLHMFFVGLAPLADAAVEQEFADAFSHQSDATESGSAPEQSAPAHAHDDCLLCAIARSAADRVDVHPFSISVVATESVQISAEIAVPHAPATSPARSRAPPTNLLG